MKRDTSKNLQSAMVKEIVSMYPTLEALQAEVKAADYNNNISLSGAKHLITGGCFLVYYPDVTEFMRENGGDKRLGDDQNWNSYVNKMGQLIYKACINEMNMYHTEG